MSHQLVVPSTDQAGDYDHSYGVIIADAIKIEQTANPPGTSQAEIHYIHSDHLNTPQRITNTAQQTVWAADYQPFGQATLTTASITNPLRFPGQYYDEETNLHYNYFRDYDPTTGRYIQSDPIGLAGGLNTYGYALQNPILYTDPKGLLSSKPTWMPPAMCPNNLDNLKSKVAEAQVKCLLLDSTGSRAMCQIQWRNYELKCVGEIAMSCPSNIPNGSTKITSIGHIKSNRL